jgi:hypothetical protein
MMKIKRYTTGATNISELQGAQRRLMSPQQAAGLAAAPYEAIANAGKSIARDFVAINERDKKLRAREDAITEKIALERFKADVSQIELDPQFENQMHASGKPSASLMLEAYEERAKQARNSIAEIQDETTRNNALQVFDMTAETTRLKMRNMVNDRREAWNAQGLFDLRSIQYESQDWTAYHQTNRELRESGIISQEQYATAENLGKNGEQVAEVQSTLREYDQQIAHGKGEEVLQEVLANPHSDPEVQAAIIAGVKAQKTNYDLSLQSEKDLQTASYMRQAQNLITSLEDPNTEIDVEAFYQTMLGADLNPTKAAAIAGQVETAQRNRSVKESTEDKFMRELEAGFSFDNTKANQRGTDGYLRRQIEAARNDPQMEGVTFEEIEIQTYMTTGLVGERRQIELQNAADVENIATQAEFWNALHKDKYMQVEDGLSSERRSMYEMIARRAKEGGMSWGEAAQNVMELQNVDEVQLDLRKQKWLDDDGAVGITENYYNSMFDENYDFSMLPIRGIGIDNVDHEANKIRYRLYLQDGLTLTGNWEDARTHADRVFLDSHVVTNINGKREMQVGGLSSTTKDQIDLDLSILRENFVQAAAVEYPKVLITKADGTSDVGSLDMEGTTLENPQKIYGDTIYQVYSNGNPAVDIETGVQLTVSFNDFDIQELKVAQVKRGRQKTFDRGMVELQKDMDELADEIRRGEIVGVDMTPEKIQLKNLEAAQMAKAKAYRDSQ